MRIKRNEPGMNSRNWEKLKMVNVERLKKEDNI